MIDDVAERAKRWLENIDDRPIPAEATIDQVKAALGHTLRDTGADPSAVIDRLVSAVEPGLMTMQSPRFFGWVIGGTQPVALAADWLVSTWDQNAGMRAPTPGVFAAEELAGEWVLDLLGLPATAAVSFVTGATMANFVGLAAGRQYVLADHGWDVNRDGLTGAPRIHFIAGEERHGAIDLAGRYLGLGEATLVKSDAQGRIRVDLLADTFADMPGPKILCLQAGNVHSGSFDDLWAAVEVGHAAGAWVHIDGAFGLWAAASPRYKSLMEGHVRADSWATDAHKTLNVPYDCGIAIVAHPEAMTGAFGMHAEYLPTAEAGNAYDRVPELSRRARGVPVWATLNALGRNGVTALVDGLADAAAALAAGLRTLPGAKIVNDVVFTQVCLAMADDATTLTVGQRLNDEGVAFASPSTWRGRAVLRFSVSNWATDATDVERTVEAVRRAITS
ncbi:MULTISPECIES: pyridoxal-dependent decarboxylase [unclassified Salinibacterium]|uniref:pyridoxal phosphate-dependent decarboxylase family protein n=1 Tax=unclassified Salinibacterium TaxID=2632331 RepID=UPI001CD6C61C|nr:MULTISPECIES: pyridoxal-dependent decarboxylase [unclassified Salinibacterium]